MTASTANCSEHGSLTCMRGHNRTVLRARRQGTRVPEPRGACCWQRCALAARHIRHGVAKKSLMTVARASLVVSGCSPHATSIVRSSE
jgi:hypothetical protein